jgi:hypothetical protein
MIATQPLTLPTLGEHKNTGKSSKPKKDKKAKKAAIPSVAQASSYIRDHLSSCIIQIKVIEAICSDIYKKFQFSGKEHHYQAALESELRDRGFLVQQEVARLLHYKKNDGYTIQLPHDIRGREDLVMPKRFCRYMDERRKYTDWRNNTRGMLINFGDNDLEVWYLFFDCSDPNNPKIVRVLLLKEEKIPLSSIVSTFDATNIVYTENQEEINSFIKGSQISSM